MKTRLKNEIKVAIFELIVINKENNETGSLHMRCVIKNFTLKMNDQVFFTT